jgi:CHAT domain-containing protein
MGVSYSPEIIVPCVACGKEFSPEPYVIVNASERPDLVDLIKRNILHNAVCPYCNVIMTFAMPLLVYRPDATVLVIHSPVPGATESQREQHEDMLFSKFRELMGEDWRDELTRYRLADREQLSSLVDLNLDLTPGGRNFAAMRDALAQFMFCGTWEESLAAVKAHSILTTREAEFSLEHGIRSAQAAGDQDAAATYTEHLKLLRESRARGAEEAFAGKCDGTGRTSKGNLIAVHGELARLARQPHKDEAVSLARAGLRLVRREDDEEEWARLQWTLGDGLLYLARTGRISRTDDATWHYKSALEFFTRERSVREWGLLTWQLLEAVKITPANPTAPQLVLSVISRAEDQDRKLDVLQAVWPAVWSGVKGDSEPPQLAAAVEALTADGMIRIEEDGASYQVARWVGASVLAGLASATGRIIDVELAAYWLRALPDRVAPGDGEAGGRVVTRILSAVPYLARLEAWSQLTECLRVVLTLDHRPATREKIHGYRQAIADATGHTDVLSELEASLTGTRPQDGIPALRQAFERSRAAGDFRSALVAGLRLSDLLVKANHARDGYNIIRKVARLAAEQPHVGAWSMLAIEIQELQVKHELGQNAEVLHRTIELRRQFTEPATDEGRDPDEPMLPHEVRENLFSLGMTVANDLREWRSALIFSDDLQASMEERGVTAYELAATRYDRYRPLLALGELDAAETILLHCREVYEHEGGPRDLAVVYGALGRVAWARGRGQQAVELQRETLRLAYLRPEPGVVAPAHWDYAKYLPEQEAEARFAHLLATAVVYRLSGKEMQFRGTVSEIAGNHPRPGLVAAATPEWLARMIGEIDGADLARLAAETAMDYTAIVSSLDEIRGILSQDNPDDAARDDSLAARWEPAIAAAVAAVHGDQHAAAALSRHLDIRELAPDWSRLVAAFRLILNGQRDPAVLRSGLDSTDTVIITRTLDALASRVPLRASPAELDAVTEGAQRRLRGLLHTMAGAAQGHPGAIDNWHTTQEAWTHLRGQDNLITAVNAVLGGAREPGQVFSALTPTELRLVRAITEAIETDATEGTKPDTAFYTALSDPIGPPYSAVGAVVANGPDLEQALTEVEQGISRRLAAGDITVPLQILELVLPALWVRGDISNALTMAEMLASVSPAGAAASIRPELAEMVCLTAVEQTISILSDSFLYQLGSAVPRITPAPLGIIPGSGQRDQARRWLAAARSLEPQAPSKPRKLALALAEAIVSRASGDTGHAIKQAQTVLTQAADWGLTDPAFIKAAKLELAAAHNQHGDLQQAHDLYSQILAEHPGDKPQDKATLLIYLADVRDQLGQRRRALADLRQAAELLGSDDDLATALTRGVAYERLGQMYELLGDLAAAATAYEHGLRLARATGHKTGEAAMLTNLGALAGKLGTGSLQPPALDELKQILAVMLRANPELTYLPTRTGARSIGVTLLRHAADLFKEANNTAGWSRAANGLANLIPDEQSQDAVSLLIEIIHAREENGDRLGLAVPLANLANRLADLGRLDEAEDTLRRSLSISRPAGYFESAVSSAQTLGLLQLRRGNTDIAETTLRDAVEMIETARPQHPAGDRSRITFAHRTAAAYQGLVECLLARGANEEAFNVVQRAKSRALLELAATTDLHPTSPVQGRFAELLAAEAEHLAVIRAGHDQPVATIHAQDALDRVYQEMAAYDADYVSMRSSTPATAESVRAWLTRQQRPILLAEYFIGLTGLVIFCLRAEWNTVQVCSTSIGASGIRRGYDDFRRQVVQYRNQAGNGWMELSLRLTEPFSSYLEPDDLVVLVPHGILHALPLHTLPAGGAPLASRHPVAYTPACGLLSLCQDPAKGTGQLGSCAAFGVTYEEEAEAVADIFGDHARPLAGLSAETIAAQAAGRDVVHFSSHAWFNPADPLGSGLFLRQGEPGDEPDPADVLTARQIMNMRLHNELVTISGCETGLNATVEGDELLGLTRAFLHAGTPSLVASLWSVDAATTREFMVRFYHHLLDQRARNGRIDKAGALREAQMDIITMKGIEASWYWAPFILIGDWS